MVDFKPQPRQPLPTYTTARPILLQHIALQSQVQRDLQYVAFLACAHSSLLDARRTTDPDIRSYLAFRARCHVRMARYWLQLTQS